MRSEPPSQLRRDLSLVDAVGIGVGAMIGAGIFVVTGVAAGVAGPAFLVGLVIAGIAATCNALSSAQLAAAYPQSGGTYEYGYRILNPWLGFSAGWMFLASKLVAAGTVALGFSSYAGNLMLTADARWLGVSAVVGLTGLNLLGIRRAGLVNTAIVGITLLGLMYFVVAGAPRFDPANLEPFAPRGWRGILESAALLFFAYTGYARLATLGEEVSEPKKTIPRAIVLSLAIASILYVAVALVAVGAIGAPGMAATKSPLGQAAEVINAPGLASIVLVCAATAMLGVLLSQILGISRMMFAMARRGDLPAILSRIHPVREVPHVGVLATGLMILLITLYGRIEFVISAASFTILLYYGIANLAAMRMPPSERVFSDWVPRLGLASSLILAASLEAYVIGSGLALLAIGLLGRLLLRSNRS